MTKIERNLRSRRDEMIRFLTAHAERIDRGDYAAIRVENAAVEVVRTVRDQLAEINARLRKETGRVS